MDRSLLNLVGQIQLPASEHGCRLDVWRCIGRLVPLSLPFEAFVQRKSHFNVCHFLVCEAEEFLDGAYAPTLLFELTLLSFLYPFVPKITPSGLLVTC